MGLLGKLVLSLTLILTGVLLIKTGLHFEGALIDLRNVVLIIATLYGGPLVALLTTLSLAVYRLLEHGFSGISSVGAVLTLFVGALFLMINTLDLLRREKLTWMLIGYSMISGIGIWANAQRIPNALTFLLITLSFNISVALMVVSYVDYLMLRSQIYQQLNRESRRDYLTKLSNVRHFDQELQRILTQGENLGQTTSLLMLDLDFFKNVNDTYGHDRGDIVLRELAKILREACRPTDIVARKGGEEFAVILQGCLRDNARMIAERIRTQVEAFVFDAEDTKIRMTISIGIVSHPDQAFDALDLVKKADLALYDAKKLGRNRTVVYLSEEGLALNEASKQIERLQWQTRFESGSEQIDKEHKDLVVSLNAIIDAYNLNADEDGFKSAFITLFEHFKDHCKNEEALLKRIGYPEPALLRHAAEHTNLNRLFDSLGVNLLTKETEFSRDILPILTKIILGHMILEDAKFFDFIIEHPE